MKLITVLHVHPVGYKQQKNWQLYPANTIPQVHTTNTHMLPLSILLSFLEHIAPLEIS